MDLKQLAEPFKKEEIEWRIAQCGKNAKGGIWASCLAYIQARAIMDRLDEVVGFENWRAHYIKMSGEDKFVPGVVCELSIRINDIWVTKSDGAEQTDIEPFKGGISGAFKRAAVVWGMGRYLYDLPSGWAVIVDNRDDGARWGKTKDGTEFFWLPPELPAWALPKPPSLTQDKKPATVQGSGVIKPKESIQANPSASQSNWAASPKDLDYLLNILNQRAESGAWNHSEFKNYQVTKFGKERLSAYSREEYDELIAVLSKLTGRQALDALKPTGLKPKTGNDPH